MRFFAVILCAFSALVVIYFLFYPSERTEWIMPDELNEISGISFINDHSLACVQDEKGIIFIYDLERGSVTKRVKFSGKGDYEGIAIKGQTAYVVSGDGWLYEIDNFLSEPVVNEYDLGLTKNQESEALCYDHPGDRLLLAFKNSNRKNVTPAIYEFNLHDKKLVPEPVISVNLESAPVKKKNLDNSGKLWQPADLTMDQSGRLYIIDAMNEHLLELDKSGELKNLIQTDHRRTDHPEGIAINSKGIIYICNDANKGGKGKIVKLDN
jgi:uncharacterized protein YjiK